MEGTVLDHYRRELARIPARIERSDYRDFLLKEIAELEAMPPYKTPVVRAPG